MGDNEIIDVYLLGLRDNMTLETFITLWLIAGIASAYLAALFWSQDKDFMKAPQEIIWIIATLSVLCGPMTLFVLWLDSHKQNRSKRKP